MSREKDLLDDALSPMEKEATDDATEARAMTPGGV